MAWRIDEQVIRGEIDNRTRGRVTGRIWFVDRAEPVELELKGNAWRDLAGRRLEFTNPEPKADESGHIARLASRQTGVIGDCTASRKVKVPDIPMDQIGEYYAARKPFPWHWGNSLYLEWFSPTNGRVVIETASFELKIGEEIAWEMSADEEEQQRRANAAEMEKFFAELTGANAAEIVDDTPEDWNNDEGDDDAGDAEFDDKPMTEEEAEKMLEDSDRLADRINARVEREGIENYEKILEEEIERQRIERGEKPLTPEEEAKSAEWMEEMNRAAEDALNNPEAGFDDVFKEHPLVARVSGLAVAWLRRAEKHHWIPPEANDEHPVSDLITATMTAGAKLAGALNGNGREWPPPREFCGHAIARLKRAHGYLDHARLAAESCVEQKLTDSVWLAEVQRELGEVIRECEILISELRVRLERDFD